MYKPLLYYVVGSPSEDDATQSGPTFGGVGSVVFLKGLGGVAPRMASTGTRLPFVGELLWQVFLACVPFFAAIIQYGPVQRKRSFPGIFPMRIRNTSTVSRLSSRMRRSRAGPRGSRTKETRR